MKKLALLCAALLVLSACSSKEKSDMSDAATADAQATADKAAGDAKAEADKKMAEGSQASKSSCVLDKDTRVIEVKKTESGGCELFYTKFGEAKSVASSGFGTQYCEEVKDRIQSNLDKAGFKCE